jgi:hypothetical protein
MLSCGVDLIAIEGKHDFEFKISLINFHSSLGMGRAIHTNLLATFKIECLKLAVIKVSVLK